MQELLDVRKHFNGISFRVTEKPMKQESISNFKQKNPERELRCPEAVLTSIAPCFAVMLKTEWITTKSQVR